MIGKNEQTSDNKIDGSRVKIITDKRKTLEDNSTKVQNEVTSCFEQLINSLKTREKQLLRQLEAVHNQQLSIVQSNWELLSSVPSISVNLDDYKSLDETIMKFGRLELPDQDGIVVKDAEPYKVEEYEEANKDHVIFDKSIKIDDNSTIIINVASPSIGKKINLYKNNNICTTELPSCSNYDNFNASLETETHLQLNNALKRVTIFDDHNYSSLSSSVEPSTLTDFISNEKCDFISNNASATSSVDDKSVILEDSLTEIHQENEKTILPINKEDILNIDDVNLKEINLNDEKKIHENDEHPKQIQQWLEQILVETETEPAIPEIQQFVEISKSQYMEFEFPLKT